MLYTREALIDFLSWYVNEDENITYRLTISECLDYWEKSIKDLPQNESKIINDHEKQSKRCSCDNKRRLIVEGFYCPDCGKQYILTKAKT